MAKERRTREAYQLRVLIDALKWAKAMTQEQWIDQWVSGAKIDTPYIPQGQWIAQLEKWALEEADRLLEAA